MRHPLTTLLTPLLTVFAVLLFVGCSSDDSERDWGKDVVVANNVNRNDAAREPALQRMEFPRIKGGSYVLIHTTNDQWGINFSVEWDPLKKAQRWTAYQMTRSYQGSAGYYGNFEEDPELPESYRVSNSSSYYSGSGFTRGHICPSADRQYSQEANRQTFYYTNMQPQYYNFNSGDNYSSPWVRLENQVRVWARSAATDTLFVVKGGTIEDDQLLTTIRGELPVPKYFFVALLLKNAQGYKAIGFWLEHTNKAHTGREPLADYAVNIEELQRLTGIDFFCNLPDDTEQRVEQLPIENVCRAWGI